MHAASIRRAAAVLLATAAAASPAACDPAVPGTEGVDPAVAGAIAKTKEANPAAWRRNVVLLGFDSCDPDLVDEMIRKGKLPNFARLRREGAWGALESISPTLSPVVWTTIATGMPPERHGILDFVTDTPAGKVPVSSAMRQADTMWDLLSRHGEQVGVVGWLVTYPAEPVNGALVTDRMGLLAFEYGKEQDTEAAFRTWPEELAADIEARDRVTVDDVPFWKIRTFADVSEREFAAAYSTKFHPLNRVGNLRLTLATAETFRAAGQRILAERRPRFFTAYFEALDALSHVFMPYAPPKMPQVSDEDFLKYRTAIEANYVWHDTVLGEYLEQADEDTTVLLVSDHGFKSGEFRRTDSSDFHAKTGAMWHRSYGVVYAWGNGVARGKQILGASVYDVAPTVLAAMGYPVPKDMRGRVLSEAFSGGLAHETVPTYFGTRRREAVADVVRDDGPKSPEEEAALERMKTLGYIGDVDRSDPATTKLNSGVSLMTSGRVPAALEQFQAVLAQERSPRALLSVADALFRLGRTAEAKEHLDEALQLDPSDPGGLVLRSRILMQEDDLDGAEKILRDAVERSGDIPFTHFALGTLLQLRSERADKAGDARAAETWRAGAVAAYERSLRLEPRQPMVTASIAQLLLSGPPDAKRLKPALDHLDRALEGRPNHPLYLNNRAIALLRLGDDALRAGRADEGQMRLEEALDSATRAVDAWRARSGREYPRGWANRAYVLWKLGRMQEASEAVKKVREAAPDYTFRPPEFLAALAAYEAGAPK